MDLRRALLSASLPVVIVACGASRTSGSAPAPQPAASASSAGARSDQRAIAKARADSARLAYTAADIHFLSGMIGHHAQAIEMSGLAPTHGAGPEVSRLAERIINAQQDEIAIMGQWLRDRLQPVPAAKAGPMKMMMDGVEHEMMMPGMLTDEQMRGLARVHGREFDRRFLTLMIQHHRGAVAMVKDLFATYGAGQDEAIFKIANDVNVDQSTEIARMERMLAALPP